MTAASCQRHKSVGSLHTFGNCYDFTMFAYMRLIYQNQTPSGLFTRRFWSTANKPIKWTVGECLCDHTHNGNCEWRDAGVFLNEVIISGRVIVLFDQRRFQIKKRAEMSPCLHNGGKSWNKQETKRWGDGVSRRNPQNRNSCTLTWRSSFSNLTCYQQKQCHLVADSEPFRSLVSHYSTLMRPKKGCTYARRGCAHGSCNE